LRRAENARHPLGPTLPASLPQLDAVWPYQHCRRFRSGCERLPVILFHVHHTVCDGRSLALLMSRLTGLLSNDPALPPAPIDRRYFQYCLLDRAALGIADGNLEYLSAVLSDIDAIPYDYPPEEEPAFGGKEMALRYPNSHIEQIVRTLGVPGVTPFSLFLTVYNLCLTRIFNVESPLIGFTSAAVPEEWNEAIGCYVSVLPVRSDARETPQFRSYAREVSLKIWNAIERCSPSFEALLPVLREREIATDFRGFQTIIAYDNNIIERLEIGGQPVSPRHLHTQSTGLKPVDFFTIERRNRLTR
jgi:hypothetical protein